MAMMKHVRKFSHDVIHVANSSLSASAELADRPSTIFALRCFIALAEILLATSFVILLLVGQCAIEVVDGKKTLNYENFTHWSFGICT